MRIKAKKPQTISPLKSLIDKSHVNEDDFNNRLQTIFSHKLMSDKQMY
ncbi:hypothetical protein T4B_6893 [Trichinella pseudospiralis]|uniref:Uncharacterized protein n=1 Tax=Trichinella pseudospiralis TaxID=6337 RepID=A0A0V1GL31_TRIPS|nr:hypothetical protein T4B_6893 [Trichinella pseudospiralis]